MLIEEKPVFRFGEFELQPAERRLLDAGRPVSMTPKVFDTLVLLVERAGHVVSKDELMKALWPRGYVEESNLTKHVWLIRRALGDGEKDSRFIETVPKLGYRFVTPVACAPAPAVRAAAAPTPAAAPEPRVARRRTTTGGTPALCLLRGASRAAAAATGSLPARASPGWRSSRSRGG